MTNHKNFFVHFEEVTGGDFEFSQWAWEKKALPVMFVWENFDIKIAGIDYKFYQGDRFNPYRFNYDHFKSFYKSGLIGTTVRKPGLTMFQILINAFFIMLIVVGVLGYLTFSFESFIPLVVGCVGIAGLLAVNWSDNDI